MTKFQKWLLIVNIAILLVVVIKIVFFRKNEWTPPPIIDNTEKIKNELDSIKLIHVDIDSIRMELNKKDALIKLKNESLIKLKNNYEKNRHNIKLLPADESIEFSTKVIDQEFNKE
jgi:hypothetical protein